MDRRLVLLPVLCLGLCQSAGAVSKCVDDQGRISYLQTRKCPPPLQAVPYRPPTLGRIESGQSALRSPVADPPNSGRKRRADPRIKPCRRLKQQFHRTREPCRGIEACRARQHRRQQLRTRYKALFCAIRSGAIDS